METNNIAKGTVQITSTNAIQYLVMGFFYIVVTKTNALTPTELGSYPSYPSSLHLLPLHHVSSPYRPDIAHSRHKVIPKILREKDFSVVTHFFFS